MHLIRAGRAQQCPRILASPFRRFLRNTLKIFGEQAVPLPLLAVACLAPLSIKLSLPFTEVYLPIEFVASATAFSVLFLVLPQGNVRWFARYPLPLFWLISFLPGIYFSDLLNTSLKFTALNGVFVIAFYYGVVLVAERGKSVPYFPFIAALVPVTVMGVYHFAQYGFNLITISGIFKPFFYSHTMYGAVMAFIAAIALGNLRQKRLWKWILLASIILTLFSGSRAALWSLVFMFVLYVLVRFPPVYRFVLPVLAMGAIFFLGGVSKVEEAFAYNDYESSAALVLALLASRARSVAAARRVHARRTRTLAAG